MFLCCLYLIRYKKILMYRICKILDINYGVSRVTMKNMTLGYYIKYLRLLSRFLKCVFAFFKMC